MEDAVLPDKSDIGLKGSIRRLIKRIDQIKDKTEEEKYDELWFYLRRYNGWAKALKPYLEDRIEAFKTLREVKIDGSESMTEIGIRFTLASLVVNELQAIIDKVETTSAVIAEKREKQKKAKKRKR